MAIELALRPEQPDAGNGTGGSGAALALPTYTNEQIALLKRTIAPGIPDDELSLALYDARRRGLDVLAGQMHLVPRKSDGRVKWTRQVSIDGYRLLAARTGEYAGSDDATFRGTISITLDDRSTVAVVPEMATVTVWRFVQGQRCPFTASARWREYYPGSRQGVLWHRMPHGQLAKVTEALALRKAFPAELSGLYTDDEMEQAPRAESAPGGHGAADDEAVDVAHQTRVAAGRFTRTAPPAATRPAAPAAPANAGQTPTRRVTRTELQREYEVRAAWCADYSIAHATPPTNARTEDYLAACKAARRALIEVYGDLATDLGRIA